MGLLDFLQGNDAQLGIGLLAAGGPTTDPNRTSIGQRLQGAMQAMDAQKRNDLQNQYLKSQIDENAQQIQARQLQAQRDARISDIINQRLVGSGVPGASPGLGTPSPAAPPMPGGGVSGASMGNMGTPSAGAWPGAPGASSDGAATQRPPGSNPATLQPSQQGQASSNGGGFPFSLNDLALLGISGSKNAPMLFDAYKYATDGVKREAGNYYKDPITGVTSFMPKIDNGMTVDGRGGVVPMAGYSQANAGIKGAEAGAVEAAKLPYSVAADRARQTTQAALDTVPVVGADNQTYYQPRLSSGGMLAGRNPVTQQSAIALNDSWIKSGYQPTIEAGKTATDLQSSIQAIRNIDAKTGWGAEAKANAASVLAGLGVGGKNAELFASNAQRFQSVAMDRLQTSLVAQKGTQTEGDADRAGKTFASLRNTPAANDFILDFAQAKANMDQRKAQFYEQALPIAQQSGDLTRVDREWRKLQGSVWADPVLQRWSK